MSRVEGSNRAFFSTFVIISSKIMGYRDVPLDVGAGPAAFDVLEGPGSIGKGEGQHDKEFKNRKTKNHHLQGQRGGEEEDHVVV